MRPPVLRLSIAEETDEQSTRILSLKSESSLIYFIVHYLDYSNLKAVSERKATDGILIMDDVSFYIGRSMAWPQRLRLFYFDLDNNFEQSNFFSHLILLFFSSLFYSYVFTNLIVE